MEIESTRNATGSSSSTVSKSNSTTSSVDNSGKTFGTSSGSSNISQPKRDPRTNTKNLSHLFLHTASLQGLLVAHKSRVPLLWINGGNLFPTVFHGPGGRACVNSLREVKHEEFAEETLDGLCARLRHRSRDSSQLRLRVVLSYPTMEQRPWVVEVHTLLAQTI